jgi:hypothetical protein
LVAVGDDDCIDALRSAATDLSLSSHDVRRLRDARR